MALKWDRKWDPKKQENRIWRIWGVPLDAKGPEKGGPKNGPKNEPLKNQLFSKKGASPC